jgi:hypothetical protein
LIQTGELGKQGLALPDDLHTVRMFIQQGAPSSLPSAERERLGKAIHQRYQANEKDRAQTPNLGLADWPALSEDLKESNRQQADNYQELLRAVNMTANPAKVRDIKLIVFLPEEVEIMAEMEHARFNVERLLSGWTLGPQRDREKKISPTLVSWADLPETEKNKDRHAVRAIPELLKQIGLEIRRISPIKPGKSRRSKGSKQPG